MGGAGASQDGTESVGRKMQTLRSFEKILRGPDIWVLGLGFV